MNINKLHAFDLDICYTSINFPKESLTRQITSELISPLGKEKSHILVAGIDLSAQPLSVKKKKNPFWIF